MMVHLILNHKPNSTFSYLYKLNIQFGDGFVGNETENRVAKQVNQGLYKFSWSFAVGICRRDGS